MPVTLPPMINARRRPLGSDVMGIELLLQGEACSEGEDEVDVINTHRDSEIRNPS